MAVSKHMGFSLKYLYHPEMKFRIIIESMSSSALHFIITIKIEEWYRDQEINVRGQGEIRDTKFEVEARFKTSLKGNFEAEEFFEDKKSECRGRGETKARNFTSFLGPFEAETRTSQTSVVDKLYFVTCFGWQCREMGYHTPRCSGHKWNTVGPPQSTHESSCKRLSTRPSISEKIDDVVGILLGPFRWNTVKIFDRLNLC